MSYSFKKESRNWVEYRELPSLTEIDFHFSALGGFHDHWESMQNVYDMTIGALKKAQQEGKSYALFTHGASTSRPGKTTSRSQVRKVMQSKEASTLIIRRECIQHESVFVAAIKPLTKQRQSI